MAHQWKAGDLAVCVNPESKYLQYRSVYRVAAVTPCRTWSNGSNGVGLIIEGYRQPRNLSGNFFEGNLRPVLPAEPQFVDAMRSLKPRVEA